MLKNYNTAAAFGLPSSLSFLARPSSDDRFIDMPCNLRFAAFRLYLAETGLGARQFCYREEGETPRVFPAECSSGRYPAHRVWGRLKKRRRRVPALGRPIPWQFRYSPYSRSRRTHPPPAPHRRLGIRNPAGSVGCRRNLEGSHIVLSRRVHGCH